MFDCPSCDTTLFRDGAALNPIGNNGEMHDYPTLLGLGDTVIIGGQSCDVVGHARYDYGRGTWDEFWVENDRGAGAWVSVDEGDVAVQYPLHGDDRPKRADPPAVGHAIIHRGLEYTVTEGDTARCIAVRGEFPEVIQVGDEHYFINASGPSGQILSGEFWQGGYGWSDGEWLDPFTLKIKRLDGSRVA
ncbi:DUF4178 domain-containing protein [Gymnodinialimonas sp. 2307UL20-7]